MRSTRPVGSHVFFLRGLRGRLLTAFLAANRDYPVTKTKTGGLTRYREMFAIHRLRPGRPLVARRSFWICTAEAGIKSGNAWRDRLPGTLRARALNQVSRLSGNRFLRFVTPRRQGEIVRRCHSDIAPGDGTIQAQRGPTGP